MHQISLIRARILRDIYKWRVFISCLEPREEEALTRLSGPDAVRTAAKICDAVMAELGHAVPMDYDRSPTYAAARRALNVD